MKTYWDTIGENYQFVERDDMKVLADLIKLDGVTELLDFAVGSGMFPIMLRKAGWEGIYTGSDYIEKFVKEAKQNNPKEEFILLDLNEPLAVADKVYDACSIIHGLEYVNDYKLALSEMKRVARRYIYLDMWQDLIEGGDKIRFNEAGGWNVNNYNREKFFTTLQELGLTVHTDIVNNNDRSKVNRIMVLKI